MSAKRMIECPHFAASNEIMNLNNNYQWILTPLDEKFGTKFYNASGQKHQTILNNYNITNERQEDII